MTGVLAMGVVVLAAVAVAEWARRRSSTRWTYVARVVALLAWFGCVLVARREFGDVRNDGEALDLSGWLWFLAAWGVVLFALWPWARKGLTVAMGVFPPVAWLVYLTNKAIDDRCSGLCTVRWPTGDDFLTAVLGMAISGTALVVGTLLRGSWDWLWLLLVPLSGAAAFVALLALNLQ